MHTLSRQLCVTTCVTVYENLGTLRRAHRLPGEPKKVARAPPSVFCTRCSCSLQLTVCRCQEIGNSCSEDALILAGDITDDVDTFAATLQCFTKHWQVNARLVVVHEVAQVKLQHEVCCSMSSLLQATTISGPGRQRGAGSTLWVSELPHSAKSRMMGSWTEAPWRLPYITLLEQA